jgi:hypothetical protein
MQIRFLTCLVRQIMAQGPLTLWVKIFCFLELFKILSIAEYLEYSALVTKKVDQMMYFFFVCFRLFL